MRGRERTATRAIRGVDTRTRRRRGPGGAAAGSPRRRWPLVGGAALAAVALVAGGFVLAGRLNSLTEPAAAGQQVTVGTAVGQRAPDFRLVDIDGRTVTRESLRGEPAILWFTTSDCVPCQEGAKSLQRVLQRIGAEDKLAVVIVFVDPGEPREALAWWKSRFGRPDWVAALAAGSMVQDYRLVYLDTKYLLDRDGVIRVADFLPLQEDPWERDLRAVLQG